MIGQILRLFSPHDRKFFPLFDKAATNLHDGGQAIYQLMLSHPGKERIDLIRKVEDIEHKGDDITHEIFKELGRNFITPLDREDIYQLSTSIDNILDYIYGSSKRIELYQIQEFTPDMIKLAELLSKATEELRRAIFELKNIRKIRNITDSLVRVNSIENHADDIFDNAVAYLFQHEKDAINLIKTKEVLAVLESATDMCEDTANIIESIILKMA
ncbi:MAG: DUF47 family protein [Bacteroidia bacterium]|nr:DUF47 domain-containing protein [Bacteroidia bacterium]MCZ2277381.1 DUF47 family protein [Bacteroidia bacterium]